MPDGMSDVKRQWIERVLGVKGASASAGEPAASFRAAWSKAAAAWQNAVETVDGQIATLQGELRKSADPRLQGIAERGMNDVTGNHKVKLMAAAQSLSTLDEKGLAKMVPATAKLVADFKTFLDSDARVALCDENPFSIPLQLRSTLGGALDGLAAALKQSGVAGA